LRDPVTGVMRDVVIRELKPQGRRFDPVTRKASFKRVVPGLNVSIPWPKREPPVFADTASDTARHVVEERTFLPTLLRPPIPEGVIDELRNKFSKFRTRHEAWFVERLEAAAERKATRWARIKEMRTPLGELHVAERERRKARGQPVLTDEMLEKIGEVIARTQTRQGRSIGVAAIEAGVEVPDAPAEASQNEAHLHPAAEEGETRPPPS
jgi:large subunit ribosomal protein L24